MMMRTFSAIRVAAASAPSVGAARLGPHRAPLARGPLGAKHAASKIKAMEAEASLRDAKEGGSPAKAKGRGQKYRSKLRIAGGTVGGDCY